MPVTHMTLLAAGKPEEKPRRLCMNTNLSPEKQNLVKGSNKEPNGEQLRVKQQLVPLAFNVYKSHRIFVFKSKDSDVGSAK